MVKVQRLFAKTNLKNPFFETGKSEAEEIGGNSELFLRRHGYMLHSVLVFTPYHTARPTIRKFDPCAMNRKYDGVPPNPLAV